jgi:hypothetical protein
MSHDIEIARPGPSMEVVSGRGERNTIYSPLDQHGGPFIPTEQIQPEGRGGVKSCRHDKRETPAEVSKTKPANLSTIKPGLTRDVAPSTR